MDKPLPTSITSYADAVDWIYNRIDYERTRPLKTSTHFRLERVQQLLAVIDSPQQRIPAVHIAGTKGKGTTAAVLSSILTSSGLQTGLFTSPHLHVFQERMQVNGIMPSEQELTDLVAELHERLGRTDMETLSDGPTYFEIATLLSWMYFDRKQVELAVLETGLGGRLDCTNVCRPLLTIITSIGLDHTHILGDTVELIAAEKAGILKPNIPVLTWVHQPDVLDVIQNQADNLQCPMFIRDRDLHAEILPNDLEAGRRSQRFCTSNPWGQHQRLELPLQGRHQVGNAALAVAAADFLAATFPGITPETVREGVAATCWPLRFETFETQPVVILDAAHNPDSIAAFAETVRDLYANRNPVLIFAASKDKDAEAMLSLLIPQFRRIIVTAFQTNPRATSPGELKKLCDRLSGTAGNQVADLTVKTADTPAQALKEAQSLAGTDGLICGTGSVFLAAELRQLLQAPLPKVTA
ncbi:MAG: folylpolyglutamate synthase/dihydrofolate synthase family protein [Planctomycetaceae bacterium]